jgi:hypothetical protein
VDRYSFIARDFHPLLLAGLPALRISCPLYPPLATEERTYRIGSSVPTAEIAALSEGSEKEGSHFSEKEGLIPVAAGDLAFGYPAKDQHELAAKCRRLKSMHAANKRRIPQAVPVPVMVHVPIRRAGPIPMEERCNKCGVVQGKQCTGGTRSR